MQTNSSNHSILFVLFRCCLVLLFHFVDMGWRTIGLSLDQTKRFVQQVARGVSVASYYFCFRHPQCVGHVCNAHGCPSHCGILGSQGVNVDGTVGCQQRGTDPVATVGYISGAGQHKHLVESFCQFGGCIVFDQVGQAIRSTNKGAKDRTNVIIHSP